MNRRQLLSQLNSFAKIALISFLPVRCAGARKPRAPGIDPLAPTPTEMLLIMEGAPGEPMRVILNSEAAGDRFLRTKSLPLRYNAPGAARLVSRMLATLEAKKGVGLAAPQVGISRRFILVQRLDMEPEKPFVAYRNPVITSMSAETLLDWEGCLSIPAGFGKVRRARSIVVEFDDEQGGRVTQEVEGFTARIFQHEIDHLDGILFIDRKEPGELMPEKEYRAMREKEKAAAGSP
jgi:peptide deformylase